MFVFCGCWLQNGIEVDRFGQVIVSVLYMFLLQQNFIVLILLVLWLWLCRNLQFVKKFFISLVGFRFVCILWFCLFVLGQLFSEFSLFGLKVRQFVLFNCRIILVIQGFRFWFLCIISIVGSLFVVFIGCVISFEMWLCFLGLLQLVVLIVIVGLLGGICWVSV